MQFAARSGRECPKSRDSETFSSFVKLDRLGRSLEHLIEVANELMTTPEALGQNWRGCQIYF
jgi:hypothetical protein